MKACVHHCVEVVVGFATGCHHLVVASLGEGKDKRTDDDDCHLVMTCLGQQKKGTLRFQPVREIIVLQVSLENYELTILTVAKQIQKQN